MFTSCCECVGFWVTLLTWMPWSILSYEFSEFRESDPLSHGVFISTKPTILPYNYSQSNLRWHFRKALSKLKAQSSKVSFYCGRRDVRALSFELWNSIKKCHPKWDSGHPKWDSGISCALHGDIRYLMHFQGTVEFNVPAQLCLCPCQLPSRNLEPHAREVYTTSSSQVLSSVLSADNFAYVSVCVCLYVFNRVRMCPDDVVRWWRKQTAWEVREVSNTSED